MDLDDRVTELEETVARLAEDNHVPPVLVKKLRPEAHVPRYMSDEAAGADLKLPSDHPEFVLLPGARRLVKLGIRIDLQPGWEAQVRPRSGLALKHGIGIVNAPGTIDSDYEGEAGVLLINLGQEPVTMKPDERVAQLVVARAARPDIDETQAGPRGTLRGAGGYGHTGR